MTEQTKNDGIDGQESEAKRDDVTNGTLIGEAADEHEGISEAEESNATPMTTGVDRRIKGPSKRTIARETRRHRSNARKSRKRLLYGIGGGFIAAALIAGLVLPSVGPLGGGGNSNTTDSATAQGSTPSVGTQQPIQLAGIIEEGAAHDAYETSPPTSGPRYASAVPWGSYEVQQPDEALVRNLEEGGIVVNHNITDFSELENLRTFIYAQDGYPGCFVIQPYEALAAGAVSITSWGWVDNYNVVDRAALQGFIADHRNAGPLFLGNTCGADTELVAGAPVDHNAGL